VARGRHSGHNIGGKGPSHTETAGTPNRPLSMGLSAQRPGFKLRSKKRRRV
jgi:hypothetical protein